MPRPMLFAWVEKQLNLPGVRIECRNVTAFETIALCTSIGKVISLCDITVFFGDDVVDLVDEPGIVGMHQTVLTTLTRSDDNQRTHIRRNVSHTTG